MARAPGVSPYFLVSKADGDELDIAFDTQRSDVPADLLELKADIEKTLSTLKLLYSGEKFKLKLAAAFAKLLSLAQVGLATASPSPAVARGALDSLKSEVLDAEGARVKNLYLMRLGAWAAVFFAIAAGVRLVIYLLGIALPPSLPEPPFKFVFVDANFLLLFAGCMGGTWLSFGIRRPVLGFFDLTRVEDDQLEPGIRLVFAGLLTLVLGLMIALKVFDLTVGAFKASNMCSSGETALLLGAICGLSEKALPSALLQRASAILQGVVPKA